MTSKVKDTDSSHYAAPGPGPGTETPYEYPGRDTTAPPTESLFGPGSQFHRFFNDPRWALAVVRATVLEAAHPQIGAALADNSSFVVHPWRRLSNTLVSLQRMFGADDDIRQREAARLNRLHARLSGTDARNQPYDAMDPEVRAWVVATLFESSGHHVAAERSAVGPGDHGGALRRIPCLPRSPGGRGGPSAAHLARVLAVLRPHGRGGTAEHGGAAHHPLQALRASAGTAAVRRDAHSLGDRPCARGAGHRHRHRGVPPRGLPPQGRPAGGPRCADTDAGRLHGRPSGPGPARQLGAGGERRQSAQPVAGR